MLPKAQLANWTQSEITSKTGKELAMPKRIDGKKTSIFVALALSLTLGSLIVLSPSAIAQQYTDSQGRPVSKDEYDGVQLMNEASQFLNQNKNAEAVFRLERAAQLAPNVADVHYNYGIALAKMGQTEEAVKQYQDATRLNPEMPYGWINMGACYQLLGKIEEAVQTYTEFVTRFPSNPEAGKIKALIVGLNKELGRQTNLPPPRRAHLRRHKLNNRHLGKLHLKTAEVFARMAAQVLLRVSARRKHLRLIARHKAAPPLEVVRLDPDLVRLLV